MRIAVIGGGAIGMLVSHYLHSVAPVTLYVRREQQKNDIEKYGLQLQKGSSNSNRMIQVKQLNKKVEEELIFIAVKQYDLHEVIEILKNQKVHNQTIIFLQNGMSHLKYMDQLSMYGLVIGIVEHGAIKKSDYSVQHTGIGRIKLANVTGRDFEKVFSFATIPNFPFDIEKEYSSILSHKLVVNAVINPLTAILKIENGKLNNNQFFYQICLSLIKEVCAIVNLDEEQMSRQVFQIMKQTAENRSSMLRDLDNGRKTEVDAILGFLIEEAIKKSLPFNQIQLLYWMIRGLEIEEV